MLPGPPTEAEMRPPSPEVLARRSELEAQIAADQAALKDLISRSDDGTPLERSPEFLEIARRLPELQAELRALEQGRDEPTEPPAGEP